jgi:hypothetical protein
MRAIFISLFRLFYTIIVLGAGIVASLRIANMFEIQYWIAILVAIVFLVFIESFPIFNFYILPKKMAYYMDAIFKNYMFIKETPKEVTVLLNSPEGKSFISKLNKYGYDTCDIDLIRSIQAFRIMLNIIMKDGNTDRHKAEWDLRKKQIKEIVKSLPEEKRRNLQIKI